MNSEIEKIDFFLPSKKVNLKEFYKKKKINFSRIFNSTGIKNIYKSENLSSIDLAIKSAKKILKGTNLSLIDGLIVVTQSNFQNLPSMSCKLQNILGLKKNVITFDINQGCSGFVYGLSICNSLIQNKQCKKILLICTDTYTKYVNGHTNPSFPIFSDGSSATIIKKTKRKKIIDFSYFTDGAGCNDLCLKKKNILHMDGKKVLMFTMNNVPNEIIKILKKNKLKTEDIDHFIFHQASKVVLKNLERKLKIGKNIANSNIERIGNTVSSSIPILISELMKKKKIRRGQLMLLCGFGVGLSISTSILKF